MRNRGKVLRAILTPFHRLTTQPAIKYHASPRPRVKDVDPKRQVSWLPTAILDTARRMWMFTGNEAEIHLKKYGVFSNNKI